MSHNPRHGADPEDIIGGGSGSSAPPSPPKPNNTMGFFGSMYTTPDPGNVDTSASGTSEEADKNIDIILGQGYSGGQGTGGQGTGGQGTGGQDTSGSGTDTSNQDTGTKDEDDKGTGIQDEKIQDFLFGTTGDPTAK